MTTTGYAATLALPMFYGWCIVCVVFLTNFVSVGLVFYSYGAFFKALVADFGGSRLGVATGLVIMNIGIAAISPLLGRAVDRGSIRHIMCGGAALMAAGFLVASRIDALWQFYAVMGTLLALGAAMMGALAGSTLVSNWFIHRRGTALGISGMGISLSGLAMAPVATALVSAIGWRSSFLVYAGVAMVTVVPAVWLLVVNRPEERGLLPDGAAAPNDLPGADPEEAVATPPEPAWRSDASDPSPWSLHDAMSDRNFWVIALVVALNFSANGAVLTHIIPHATDIGFDPYPAAYVLSTMAGFGVAGKVLFGWIADRVPKRVALWLASGLQGLGIALILRAEAYSALLGAGAVFGLGMGGLVPLWGALIGAGFGRRRFGRVMGLMSPFMLPVQILGIPYAGWIYDRTGSYDIAFFTFLGAYVLAILTLAFLRLPESEPDSVPVGVAAPPGAGAPMAAAASPSAGRALRGTSPEAPCGSVARTGR